MKNLKNIALLSFIALSTQTFTKTAVFPDGKTIKSIDTELREPSRNKDSWLRLQTTLMLYNGLITDTKNLIDSNINELSQTSYNSSMQDLYTQLSILRKKIEKTIEDDWSTALFGYTFPEQEEKDLQHAIAKIANSLQELRIKVATPQTTEPESDEAEFAAPAEKAPALPVTKNEFMLSPVDVTQPTNELTVALTHGARKILGLRSNATQADITRAFRQKSLQYHPDKTMGLSQAELEKNKKMFEALQAAKSLLIDGAQPSAVEERKLLEATGKTDSEIASLLATRDEETHQTIQDSSLSALPVAKNESMLSPVDVTQPTNALTVALTHGARKILGLRSNATQADIARAFRQKSLQYHPDKTMGLSQAELEKNKKMFEALQAAKSLLIDGAQPSAVEERKLLEATGKTDSEIASLLATRDEETHQTIQDSSLSTQEAANEKEENANYEYYMKAINNINKQLNKIQNFINRL